MDIKEVLNGNIFKVWAKFIIASVVGVVLNTIYTMVDGIFIGQGVGEVGLAGEIRAVNNCEQRISEAKRLGFERCIIPFHNYKSITNSLKSTFDIIPVRNIREAFSALVEE